MATAQPGPLEWDAFVGAQDGHLLQTARWGALKRDFGWEMDLVSVAQTGQIAAGALALTRNIVSFAGSVTYVPRGPVVNWSDTAAVEALLAALDATARRRRAIMLKIEPDELDTPEMRLTLERYGFRRSPQSIQPPRTILIDITGSEDDVLMRMSQTTRRKVRTGAKKDIQVRRGSASDLDSFNTLMQATGARNEFGVHSPGYYRRAIELFAPDHGALLLASYKGRDLAGLMVFALGKTAWYFYGASSEKERERMPTYALQWEAIRWARELGCTTYDLWGIPDEDEAALEAQFQQRSDGLWGVYGFKRGFGGRVVRAVGAWDRIYKPVWYAAYRLALRGRQLSG